MAVHVWFKTPQILQIFIYLNLCLFSFSGCTDEGSEAEKDLSISTFLILEDTSDEYQDGMLIKRGEVLHITPSLDEEDVEDLSLFEALSSDEDVATVEVKEEVIEIQTLKAGEVTITVKYGSQAIEQDFEIKGPESLDVDGPDEVNKGDSFTLKAVYVFEDASKEEIDPSEVTWESLTTAASVNENGDVVIEAHGHIQIKVQVGDFETTWEKMIQCNYPEPTTGNFDLSLALESVIPPLYWDSAFVANDGAPTRVSFEDFYCSDEFSWVSTINLMITAGWCPACPDYMRAMNSLNPELKEAGGLMIYVDVQDNDYGPATSQFADDHLSRVLGDNAEGYFVGDADTKPVSRFFGQSPAIEAFPDAYVVRKSDMKIITSLNLNRDVGLMPLVEIAQNPDMDWTSLEAAPPPPFESICEEGDDEPSEPNNDESQAAALSVGTMNGGICDENPDVFSIDLTGSWTVTLDFQHAQADLDLYLLGPEGLMGEPLQASNSENDQESITAEGPGTIVIISYNRKSTLYTLTLTEN